MAEDRILPNLKTRLTLDSADLKKGQQDVGQLKASLGSVGDGFESKAHAAIVPGVGRIVGDAARVVAAAKIFDYGRQGLDELKSQQEALAVTEAHIKSTGGAANVTADDVLNLSGSLSDLSGVDDEVIQSGENMLLTFKAIRNEAGAGNDIFNQATTAALDLSKAGFGSVESASVLLGKALQDPIKGVTALQRVGVGLSAQQKEQIKTFVESGDVLSAQKVILKEVESQVGGTAAAYGETLAGRMDRAKNASDDMKAALVGGMAPALELGANAATFLANEVATLPAPLQAVIGITALVGGGIGALIRPISDVVNLYRAWAARSAEVAGAEAVQTGATLELAGAEVVQAGAATASAEATAAAETASIGAVGALGALGIGLAAAAIAYEGLTHSTQVHIDVSGSAKLSNDDLIEQYRFLHDAFHGAGLELDVYNKMADTSLGTVIRLRDVLRGQGEDTSSLDKIIADHTASQHQANLDTQAGTDAADGQTSALGAEADAFKSAADAAKVLSDALDAQAQASESLLGANLSVRDAQTQLADSLGKVDDAQKAAATSGGDHAKEQHDLEVATTGALKAIDSQAQSLVNQAKTQAEASGQTLSAQDSQRIYIQSLIDTANTLAPDSPLRAQLSLYIAQLQQTNGRFVASFDIDLSAATASINAFAATHPGVQLALPSGVFRPMARGGDLEAGVGYIVGDKYGLANAEVFVPGVSGHLFPDVNAAAPRTAGASFEQHLTVNGSPSDFDVMRMKRIARDAAADVVRELLSA